MSSHDTWCVCSDDPGGDNRIGGGRLQQFGLRHENDSGLASAGPSSPVDSATLPTLLPTSAGTQTTKGADNIADNGIHLHFQVTGAPNDVMSAYKAALEGKGWELTTVVTSGGGGGGGATYTGTNGAAYSVFDGGGYQDKTYMDVCAWPAKPANPDCRRGDQ